MEKQGSLTIVGMGIQVVSHLTFGAKTWIEQADKVFYLVSEKMMEEWIHELQPKSEPLPIPGVAGERRRTIYHKIVDTIMAELRKASRVCVIFYGHPGVFADPAHMAIAQAKKEGFFAQMLPGISADACMFADLGIDPGKNGYQSFEATDFLIRSRVFDPRSVLVLWQVGMVGNLSLFDPKKSKQGLKVLTENLIKTYGPDHQVIRYEAATLPINKPLIYQRSLKQLPDEMMSPYSTLYIPPKEEAPWDKTMMSLLNMEC